LAVCINSSAVLYQRCVTTILIELSLAAYPAFVHAAS
jgi:hypothetical protein